MVMREGIQDVEHMAKCSQYMETFYDAIRFYHENIQNHVKKPVCIFISVGGQDILDPAMPV